jgi:hypothetical protein
LALIGVWSVGCQPVKDYLDDLASAGESDDNDSEPTKKKKKKKKKKKSADDDPETDAPETKAGMIVDTGFRPNRDGFAFQNTGGSYPRTRGVVDSNVMVRLFGKDACIDGDTANCSLTLPAREWAGMINRAMNMGQCEGMAVSSLTYWKKIDKPSAPFMATGQQIPRTEATPNIAYYWSYQALDPLAMDTMIARRSATPNQVEDRLAEMFKRGEFATLAFWGPPGQGGHAVTPYAIEDKGNDVHWIKVYDNNWPNQERHVIIDRKANTWRYELAALNPNTPKQPWMGNALNHSLVIRPLDLRLKKPVCPFCRASKPRRTIWGRAASVSISDEAGHKLAVEGDKITNDIPDAQVIEMSGWLEDGSPIEPIFVVPEGDYDVEIAPGPGEKAADDAGVTVFGSGEAVRVSGVKLGKDERDSLRIGKESGALRYRSATGKIPALTLTIDEDGGGKAISVRNLESDPDSEVELKHDVKAAKFVLGGGGKATKSYDLELEHAVKGSEEPERAEQKGVPFRLGESHGIDAKRPTIQLGKPGGPTRRVPPPAIARGVFKPRPKPAAAPGAPPPSSPAVPRLPGAGKPTAPPKGLPGKLPKRP